MTNFVKDFSGTSGLSGPVSDLPGQEVPAGADANQYADAAKWNQMRQAMFDTRNWLRASQFTNALTFGMVGDGNQASAATNRAALQAAIDALAPNVNGAFGGYVEIPPGVFIIDAQLTLPSGVGLRGAGPSATILKLKNATSVASMIRNLNQDGTQEYAFLESMTVDGNQAGGASCTTAVVDFVSLFVNSYVRDVVILNGSNVGLHIAAGGTPGGMGPLLVENVWVANTIGHGVLIEELAGNAGACDGIVCVNLTSEHQGNNKSAVYLKGLGSAAQWNFINTHIELGQSPGSPTITGQTGITLDGVTDVNFHGIQLLTGSVASVTAGIAITNVAQNARFRFDGIVNANLINPVVNDAKNSVTIGAVPVCSYVAPDYAVRGGMRFTPHTTAGSKGLVAQNSSGTDTAWFDNTGVLTGNSPTSAGLDVGANTADGSTGRVLALINQARTRAFGFYYPDSSFCRFRAITAGIDAWDIDNSGNMRVWNLLTVGVGSAGQGIKGVGTRAAAPSSGAHVVGEVVLNADPIAGGKVGWVCITAGTPGTWKAFGAIDP